MSQLTKETMTSLIREAFPAINTRSLQVMLNGYLHKGTLWHCVYHNKIHFNYWTWHKFETLIEKVKELEEQNGSHSISIHK